MSPKPKQPGAEAVARLSRRLLIGIAVMALPAALCITLKLGVMPYGSGYAEHVVLDEEACSELRNARLPDGTKPPEQAFPCAFTGYLYPTQVEGLLVVDGLSENIKGKCLTLAANIIDTKRSYTDNDYPRQLDMPPRVLKACKGKLP
ncbi:hypothetical protein [Rhodanobacter sp. FW106-PBR-LB-2-11]|uniref:hypothetical protein n=1 Tax=Rhodanobacter sp. FW106-PBR-LB-2-11 TaxID=1524463 RepID=UPI0034E53951